MENFTDDELINAIVSDVLERMKLVQKSTISWMQFVAVYNGNVTNPEIAAQANKLLDDILVDAFGSVEGYQKFLDKQEKQYQAYMKQVDENQKEYVPSPVVKTSPPLPTKTTKKTRNTPVTQDVKSSSIANKIGAKRRGKTIEELAAEKNMDVSTYLWFHRNER